jgi:hypothetical protein
MDHGARRRHLWTGHLVPRGGRRRVDAHAGARSAGQALRPRSRAQPSQTRPPRGPGFSAEVLGAAQVRRAGAGGRVWRAPSGDRLEVFSIALSSTDDQAGILTPVGNGLIAAVAQCYLYHLFTVCRTFPPNRCDCAKFPRTIQVATRSSIRQTQSTHQGTGEYQVPSRHRRSSIVPRWDRPCCPLQC